MSAFKQYSTICTSENKASFFGSSLAQPIETKTHPLLQGTSIETSDPQMTFGNYQDSSTFYLKFKIKNESNNTADINLKLILSETASNSQGQIIKTFTLPSHNNTQTHDLIFTSYNNFIGIRWEQVVILENLQNNSLSNYSIFDVELYKLAKILPIGNTKITKLGIQAPPSAQVAINGQPIRIGRNGIFELIQSIDISSIHIAPKIGEAFLIDYKQED